MEGLLLTRRVDDLQSLCSYRYHGMSHTLERMAVSPATEDEFASLVHGQTWTDGLSAMIVFVADYAKLGWKYSDASGYNGLLLEAGHIAQSISLIASSIGLGVVPTNAIDQNIAERLFGLHFPTQAAIYVLGVGSPIEGEEGYGDYAPELVDRFVKLAQGQD